MNILLWSEKGAGNHYHGPGMNAWRMYSKLNSNEAKVHLIHGTFSSTQNKLNIWSSTTTLNHIQLGKIPFFKYPLYHFNLISYLKKTQDTFDVFHALSGYFPSVILGNTMECFGIPAFIKIAANGNEVIFDSFHRNIRRILMKKITGYIAISDEIANSLLKGGISSNKIHRIPNGVDTNLFYPGPDHSITSRNSFKILFAGGIVRRKRLKLIVESLPHIKCDLPIELIVAGPLHDLTYYQEIIKTAIYLNVNHQIQWLGFVDNMPELFRSIDLLCLPSENEGMANVVLEAMATGIPFVVTDTSGMKELAIFGGGEITNPNPSHLGKTISRIIKDWNNYRTNGIKAVKESYDSRKILELHLELFNSYKRS